MDEKQDKLLANAQVVTHLKADIEPMTVTVNGLTDDLNKLKKNTDAIPNIRSQLKQIQDDITTLKDDNATAKRQLTETSQRLKELEEENSELITDLDNLTSKLRRESNINEKSLEEKVAKHMQRQHDKIIEGVPESIQEDLKKIVQQIAYDAGVQIYDKEITEAYRLGKFNKRDRRSRSSKFTLTTRSRMNNIYRNRKSTKQTPACSEIWVNEFLDNKQKKEKSRS